MLLLAVGLGFGPYVRGRVAREAERRGLVVTVGSVRPGWFAVSLHDVTVAPEGVDGASATLGTVSVSSGEVHATGVALSLADDVLPRLAEWRERHASKSSSSTSKGSNLVVEESSLIWQRAFGDPDASAELRGLSLRRDEAGVHLALETATLTRANASLELAKGSVELVGGQLRDAHVDSARVALTLRSEDSGKPAAAALPEPPVLPVVHKRNGPKGVAATTEPFRPLLPEIDLHVARAMLKNAGVRLEPHFPDGARVSLDQLTVELTRGKERLELGPGKVALARQGDELALDFSAGMDQSPLAVRATVPIAAGDAVLALSGGPVTLSMLGVREGAFGFVDPAHAKVSGRARLALDDAATALTFDEDVSVANLSIKHPRLADETVRGLDVRISARGVLDDKGGVRLDDAEAQLGAAHLRVHGGFEQTSDHLAASLSLELPVAGCQSLLESVPSALFPHLVGARFVGTLGAKGYVSFDTRRIDDMILRYDFDDSCKMAVVPEELQKDRFQGVFHYAIVDKDGKPDDRETGPGTDEWLPIDVISPMMQVAVLTTEDGAFYHHHGFNHSAIRSALVADIKAGRFVRGASTITMQLAKNLFLSREKTVSRKLEEVILADYLEKTFKKEELMELYLNIVEFGPDVYGAKAAADHYFGRRAIELNLAESLFLSSLLPRPRDYHKIYEKGEVPQSWMNNIHQLMEIANKTGKISDQELRDGLGEPIVFHHEDAPPPAPRGAVSGSHFTGDDDWETN